MTALQLAHDVSDATLVASRLRVNDVAAELKRVIRLAGRNPEALEGQLPCLSQFARVTATGELDDSALVYFILHHLIAQYRERLPGGRDCQAIRALLAWEDADGEPQSLTTRYHKAAAHLVSCASDFGRRQEPRLLRECARRFIALDHEDRLARQAPIDEVALAQTAAQAATPEASVLANSRDPFGGIARVHPNLNYHRLIDLITDAQQITILNTWIPGLDILADSLIDALARGSDISILLLDPTSPFAQPHNPGQQASTPGRFHQSHIGPGVWHCLDLLTHISRSVDVDHRRNLRIRLYNTLPSISAYAIDERAFISFFTHGQLAIRSVQIEVLGRTSTMGQFATREIETLWNISNEAGDALHAA